MATAILAPEARLAPMARGGGAHGSLADALDRILYRGVAAQGNVTIGLADVDLLFVDLRLLVGSIDAIWPEGRPMEPLIRPRAGPGPPAPPPNESEVVAPREAVAGRAAVGPSAAGVRPEAVGQRGGGEVGRRPGTAAADGLTRLVLTLVKLLHDLLERQAVRRMEAGRLSATEIEAVGNALCAQAEEIARLQKQFGFSDQDLSLGLAASGGALS